ncbi:MAG: hypothetical protein DMF11_07675 [Verrucomicrobia bacterium]|nr:MAG: hypothetical protein DMF11_07675 [Verrucomicrobiota bacterium]
MKTLPAPLKLFLPLIFVALMPATTKALDPTAGAITTNVTNGGGTSYSFAVRYADDGEIDVGSLDSNDVRVTGPGGFNVAATFVSVNINTNGTPRIATYSIVPPGGSWNFADNGTYNVVMQANQVFDGIGNPVAAGNIGSFTVAVGMSSPTPTPALTSNSATNVASFSATLNGSLNPHGATTSVYFQYGLTTSYGSMTATHTKTGNTAQAVSANISGLNVSTTYHFRIVAHNSGGTSFGSDRTFTTLSATGSPVVATKPATLIASFSAALNGSLDPHGLTTSVHFQYGTTTAYGLTTAPQSQSGNTYRNVSANISSLTASTTYHFRIVASNSSGTTMGSDKTVTTLSATGAPVVTTGTVTNKTASSATLNGSLDPHGLATSVSFQYGTTTSYGHTTPTQSQSGNTYRNIAAAISGLTTHTTYHFRMMATNSGGTRLGSDGIFTTP